MRSILTLLFLTLATPALAVDGVVEINHTCAVQSGCFVGDSPGYPVFIDGQAGGSYRLTSNLIVPNENTDGIRYDTGDISIDLNGFAIIGVGCVGSVTNCTPGTGTGSGIERTSALHRGVSVKNGSITGMGNYGLFIGDQAHISGVSARWNRLDGINTSSGGRIAGNTAYQNGRRGINVFAGATVSGNTVYENGSTGIFASAGSTVSGNTVRMNGGTGISTNNGSTVSGNTVTDNGSVGIYASDGCTVNGNVVRGHASFGMDLDPISPNTAYRDNVVTGNGGPLAVLGGINMGGNSCNGTTTCP